MMTGSVIVQKLEIYFTRKLGELVISFLNKNFLVIFLLDTISFASFTLILIICPKLNNKKKVKITRAQRLNS